MNKKRAQTAKELVNSILDREIVWVDWKSLPTDARKAWGKDAEQALHNRTLQSLIGKSSAIGGMNTSGELVKRCIEQIARRSKSHDETHDTRMIMCGVELIRELLEEMLVSEGHETKENLNEPI